MGPGESGVRRLAISKDVLVQQPSDGIEVVDGKEIVEKKWKYFELSYYKYMSYLDVKTAVSEIGHCLVDLSVPKGDVFNIHAQTGYAPHTFSELTPLVPIGSFKLIPRPC